MEKKSAINIDNIIFVCSVIALAIYSIFYNKMNPILLTVILTAFILVKSISEGAIDFDFKFCILVEIFLVKGMLDQMMGRPEVTYTTMVLPILMYMFGKLLIVSGSMYKRLYISLGVLTAGNTIVGLVSGYLTSKSPFASQGYYSVAFAGDVPFVSKTTFLFSFIFAVVAIVILVFVKIYESMTDQVKKKANFILKLAAVVVAIVFIFVYFKSDRFEAFKVGLYYMSQKPLGNFAYYLPFVIGGDSTKNMWGDFGRDYGVLIFLSLLIFFALTIWDAIKLWKNKQVPTTAKAWLLLLFVTMNIFYFVDSGAYIIQPLWYMGLMINGMISVVCKYETNN